MAIMYKSSDKIYESGDAGSGERHSCNEETATDIKHGYNSCEDHRETTKGDDLEALRTMVVSEPSLKGTVCSSEDFVSSGNQKYLHAKTAIMKPRLSANVSSGIVTFVSVFYILKTFLECLNVCVATLANSKNHDYSMPGSKVKVKIKGNNSNELTLSEMTSAFFAKFAEALKKRVTENPKFALSLPLHKVFTNLPETILTICPAHEMCHFFQAIDRNPDMSKDEQMTFELARYATFQNYPESPISVMTLSKAGFHYEGNGDEVVCSKCKKKYRNWESTDDPLKIHARLSPTCEFVSSQTQNQDNSRLPTMQQGASGDSSDIAPRGVTGCTGAREAGSSSTGLNRNDRSVIASSDVTGQETNTITANQEILGIENEIQRISIGEPSVNSQSPSNRERTTGQHGTQSHLVNSASSTADITLTSLPRQSRTTNALRPQAPPSTNTPSQSNPDQSENRARSHSDANRLLTPLGINTQRPKHQRYAVLATRLATFERWPKAEHQNPETMAKAGFIYEGSGDSTVCFFCGGGLKEWEPHDDPWIEHARWYRECVYVQQCKGAKFVEDVLKGNITGDEESATKLPQTDALGTPAAISVMEMGYSRASVQRAIETFLKNTGNDLQKLRADNLLDIVWDLEENNADEVKCQEAEASNDNPTETNSGEKPLENESLESLLEENQRLKDSQICKICMDEDSIIVFLPCGHMVTCANCAPAVKKCPICRAFIRGTVKAILS